MVKKSFLFGAIATTLTALTQTVFADVDSNVISLTEKNFDSKVLGEDLMLVEFYAPWCGHCKALAPEYEIAATQLKETLPLAKVDCTENQDVCSKYGVRGYPTLKVFRKGETSDYKGSRKADGIVSYMKKQALPAISQLDASNLTDFTTSDRIVVIGYTSDEASKQAITEVAEKLRDDYVFGLVTDEALAKENKAEFPSIVLYKQFDEGRNDLNKDITAESIQSFIKANSVPLFDGIDASTFPTYVESGLPLAFAFYENDEQKALLDSIVTPLAKDYKGKVNFVSIDATKFGGHAKILGLQEGQYPAFAIQHLTSGAKYPLRDVKSLTADNLKEFLKEYNSGNMKAYLRSAVAPEQNDGPVKVVVANEFKDIVLDDKKDVFLEVYAPWCGHCKRLAPTWEQLGQAVAEQDSNIVIAKMDGTENDIPEEAGFELEGFPTLKFFKAGTNEVVDYDGDRSMEDLVDFISKNSAKNTKIVIKEDEGAKEGDKASNDHDEL
ncbi:thioredoxin-like protein [Mycotypha africana]|uniref:thioredoxin-like protein n=1 Tax=Mycotypha africana TaxID=64632 RepID=UPI00230121F1|nr:thioredoxin-like protein [Mycotypha africana]KAI8982052.1 thioredoxin-like protein [Mycotypha africana]